ncbi:MAG TPA: tRNA pseudouridine(55) synthase TruB, partial [Erysipelothrix sp.]|nr:tRNA pseudouridine(55) synthase TruB [Erysipelothrix sp.]
MNSLFQHGENMNGIVCINKDEGMTSFDVIRTLKRKYRYKFGHSGTLDPNATGLLLVAVNKATKALNYIDAEDKVYVGTCQLGIKTDTGDIWGQTLNIKPLNSINQSRLES